MSKSILIFRWFFTIFGIISFLFLVLSFTDLPYYAYYNLGIKQSKLQTTPDIIIVLGGGGMPSPDGLIRTYYASEAALKFSHTKVILAHPSLNNCNKDQLVLMAKELVLKGVDSTRINFEENGINTRTQALNIANMFDQNKKQLALLIITSPEHMYRSCKTFKHVGFKHVGGIPAFEKPIEEEGLISKDKKIVLNLSFRYNMWSYMQYEILVLREYCAIAYYKFKGWM